MISIDNTETVKTNRKENWLTKLSPIMDDKITDKNVSVVSNAKYKNRE